MQWKKKKFKQGRGRGGVATRHEGKRDLWNVDFLKGRRNVPTMHCRCVEQVASLSALVTSAATCLVVSMRPFKRPFEFEVYLECFQKGPLWRSFLNVVWTDRDVVVFWECLWNSEKTTIYAIYGNAPPNGRRAPVQRRFNKHLNSAFNVRRSIAEVVQERRILRNERCSGCFASAEFSRTQKRDCLSVPIQIEQIWKKGKKKKGEKKRGWGGGNSRSDVLFSFLLFFFWGVMF